MHYETYHELIQEEFQRRKDINEAYSLRAFARDIGISAPRLSQVLSKKHGLSVKAAEKIAENLKLNQEQAHWFCSSVGAQHSRKTEEKKRHIENIKSYKNKAKVYNAMEMEYFKVISDWYHYAILELTYLEDFQNSPKWISEVLEISEKEATAAMDRLKSLGFLEEKDGVLIDKFEFLTVNEGLPSNSIKKFHSQVLRKAIKSLYDQSIENREVSSNIFAIHKNDLELYKNHIKDFRRNLEQIAKNQDTNDAVYCLGIQFFELTRGNR